MKFTQAAFALLALASAAVAAPATDATTTPARSQIEWTGDNTLPLLEARGRGVGESCTVGKGQCASGLGCYGCLGHKPVCQQGPGSNECCYRDDRGPRCDILPIGK
ncbi:hypothetical protein F4819DRAFT_507423 [Hypoxylon fuscum]|nr:hypothetical protein F4819DRAFT_507423 [Hypoxylon fuscum]